MAVCCAPACSQYPHLHHDVITGRCLLRLVHPALDHIEAAFQQVLWAGGLVKGSKESCPSCHNPVISHMQPGPPHCPEPKTMDGQTDSCHPHSPHLTDFLPDASPDNLPCKEGVVKATHPSSS